MSGPVSTSSFSPSDRRRLFTCSTVSTVASSEVSIYPYVDTSECVHEAHHLYLHSLRPDGHGMTLTAMEVFHSIEGTDIKLPKRKARATHVRGQDPGAETFETLSGRSTAQGAAVGKKQSCFYRRSR